MSALTYGFILLPAVRHAYAQPVTQPFTFSFTAHNLPHVEHGNVIWGDVDADGDLDVFVSGRSAEGIISDILLNLGKRESAEIAGVDSVLVFQALQASIEPLVYSRAALGDFDGDGDLDLAHQGSRTDEPPYDPVTQLYRNEGGAFVRVSEVPFIGAHSGAVRWGDFDNDGDVDLLVAGERISGDYGMDLYVNEGGAFRLSEASLPSMAYGDARWGDYDGDGDLDLAVAGIGAGGLFGRVLRNAQGSFSIAAELDPVAFASVDWADHDKDGDLDLIVSGGEVTPFVMEGATRLYENDGASFRLLDAEIAGVFAGLASWGDYDDDGDFDVLAVGSEEIFGRRTARLYRNESGGWRNISYLTGLIFGSVDWGDFEGDGDLDLIASGRTSSGFTAATIYENVRQVKPPEISAPAGLQARVEGDRVELTWADHPGMTFNLRVGTREGAADVASPNSFVETGRRLIGGAGNAGPSSRWMLRGLKEGTYYWTVQALDGAYRSSAFAPERTFTVSRSGTATADEDDSVPRRIDVSSNFPNPFHRETRIRIELPEAAQVILEVYDVLGSRMARTIYAVMPPGVHSLIWIGADSSGRLLGSGIYLYKLRLGDHVHSGQMVIVR